MAWPVARRLAAEAVRPVAVRTVPLAAAADAVLAEDARACTALPAADTSAMDGWAVAGPPPWRLVGQVLAGQGEPAPLHPGTAVTIATGALLPAGADGVLRREWGALEAGERVLRPGAGPDSASLARDVRRAGTECALGEVVLPAGARLGPVSLGLLAAAGLDELPVRRAELEVLVLGDELLDRGPARDGRLRDALGPLLAAWLPRWGAAVRDVRRVPDRAEELHQAIAVSSADALITTGSTARGPVDHLHAVLGALGARLVVDGVAVRPGHPQLLALLPDGRPVVGLPGNPLAAVSGLLTLVRPVLAGLHALAGSAGAAGPAGASATGSARALRIRLQVDVGAGADATRLVPVADGRPVMFAGPAMLRGLAQAEGVAVIPPGGARSGDLVEVLPLP